MCKTNFTLNCDNNCLKFSLMFSVLKMSMKNKTYERFFLTNIVIEKRPPNRKTDKAITTVYNNPVKHFDRFKRYKNVFKRKYSY